MPAYPQFWSNDKISQIITESSETVAAGATGATTTQYLFNDKGSLLGATSMTGYYLVVEASHDGGQTWLRSGMAILDERWVEVSITGTVDSTGGAPAAQTTAFTAIGTGLGQAITAIPQGSGRQISYRLNVPTGASAAGVLWRIVESSLAPVITASSIAYTPAGTVSATDIQAAITELDTEKAPKASPTITGDAEFNQEDGAVTVDSAGLKRFGFAKSTGLDPELRFLSSISLRFRRVTTGSVKTATASDVPITLNATGTVTFGADTFRSGAEVGRAGMQVMATAAAADYGYFQQFRHVRAAIPTVSLTAGTQVNITSNAVPDIRIEGFFFQMRTTAAGNAYHLNCQYTTSA